MQTISIAGAPFFCAADGENIWTIDNAGGVTQTQASTGRNLNRWTSATSGLAVLATAGKVFVAANTSPSGTLYVIDPSQPPGAVTVAASNLGNGSNGIASDGTYIWTADFGPPGSVSLIFPPSYIVGIQTTGFLRPSGILYDGAHIWVTDFTAGTLLKVQAATGGILQTVPVGAGPQYPVFDGANIWVPNWTSYSITVVQASTGNAAATISSDASNMLSHPTSATFDGERVLVTNGFGNTVTLFKAADLSFIANVTTGAGSGPTGACSDGINFWVPLHDVSSLLRF
jgi:hypothetical protein